MRIQREEDGTYSIRADTGRLVQSNVRLQSWLKPNFAYLGEVCKFAAELDALLFHSGLFYAHPIGQQLFQDWAKRTFEFAYVDETEPFKSLGTKQPHILIPVGEK